LSQISSENPNNDENNEKFRLNLVTPSVAGNVTFWRQGRFLRGAEGLRGLLNGRFTRFGRLETGRRKAFKKNKKKFDSLPCFWNTAITHGNNQSIKLSMRTKTLLIAAAALAATIISSEAQTPVYSGNVVGYVSVPTPSGQFIFMNNPLTTGNDVISNVVQNVPGGTTADVWNGSGFSLFTYSALSGHWKQGSTIVDTTPLPPGVAFFLTTPTATNVTFVGTVVAPTGGTATNALTTALSPVGALVPISDVVTNPATFNLQVAGGSTLQQWNIPNQQFSLFTYSALSHSWKIGSTATNPIIGVGEGFFIQSATATNWVQALPGS
jgi:hypothetical protein